MTNREAEERTGERVESLRRNVCNRCGKSALRHTKYGCESQTEPFNVLINVPYFRLHPRREHVPYEPHLDIKPVYHEYGENGGFTRLCAPCIINRITEKSHQERKLMAISS